MALQPLPYVRLSELVREYLSTEESEQTTAAMRRLRAVKARGYFTPAELEIVCRWKSPRALPLVRSNPRAAVRIATKRALGSRTERRRLEALTSLRGVSVPMASAALTLLYPRRYGVIDIRVWQLLHALGEVAGKPSGVGFNFENWYQFLMIVRRFATLYGVQARDVERALFRAHEAYQDGVLYSAGPRASASSRRPPS